jgi:hypothetical protein
MTMQDLINQQTSDAATLVSDAVVVSAAVTAVSTAQAQEATDTTTQSNDAAAFQSALATTGPVAAVSADGTTIEIYAAPGTVIQPNTPYPVASSVPVPVAAPPPPPPALPPPTDGS